MQNSIRLNRFLSQAGLCSRRSADKLIEAGRVTVNGQTVSQMGLKINLSKDKIKVDGRLVSTKQSFVYALFHKPKNVLTTLSDPKGRPHITDFLKGFKERVFPVGRLDWDAEGMLILTNDGDLAHRILHPRFGVTKTYLVKINGQIKSTHIQKLQRGISILGRKVKAKDVVCLKTVKGSYPWVKITIFEGKNQQIKRMFQKVGFDVLKLKRVCIGKLTLGKLKKGEVRRLTPKDLSKIFAK